METESQEIRLHKLIYVSEGDDEGSDEPNPSGLQIVL
jgi:hypothetical protein